MEISKIEFQNYKSFEKAEINISPITILLGANSIGKSSVIQLLLMIAQTFKKHGNGDLLLNSNLIELGEDINLLKDKDATKKLKIKFHLYRNINIYDNAKSYMHKLVQSLYQVLNQYENVLTSINNPDIDDNIQIYKNRIIKVKYKYFKDIRFHNFNNDNPIVLKDFFEDSVSVLKSMKKFINKVISEIGSSSTIEIQAGETFDELKNININMYLKIFYAIPDISGFFIDSIEYTFVYKEKKLCIEKCELLQKDISILELSFLNEITYRNKFSIKSNVIDNKLIKILKIDFSKSLKIKYLKPHWNDVKRNSRNSSFSNIVHQAPMSLFFYGLLESTIDKISSRFRKDGLHHVKPIRAYPKRYYFVKDQMNTKNEVNINEGESMISILQSRPTLLKEINIWLKENYNLNIIIKPITDVIYSIGITHNNLKLDLSDVGFGISQILPILIQLLSDENGKSTIIIEQPEIHIHPKAQADLIDLFILIANKYEKEIIIETHSEAFLKRLRRRISEYTEENLITISSNNVSIHTFEREDNTNIINNIKIELDGDFEWPKEFLDYSLEDTVAYLKNKV